MSTKRKNTKIFSELVDELTKGEYFLLSEYKNNRTKVMLIHIKCGNIYYVKPNSFLSKNSRCTECSRNKKKTTEKFSQEVTNLTDGEYLLLSEYKNNKIKVTLKHLDCGNVYCVKPNSFLSKGSRCTKCAKKKEKDTHAQFIEKLNKKFHGRIIALEEYKDNRVQMKFKCIECNDVFYNVPNSLLSKVQFGCNQCRLENTKRKYSYSDIIEYLSNTRIQLLSTEYRTTTQNLVFKCLNCERKFTSNIHTIMRQSMKQCKGCSITETNSLNEKDVINYINNETTATYVSGNYKKNTSKLMLKCECGNRFFANWLKIKQRNKTRCNECSVRVSSAEYKTMSFLKENNIAFEYEYRFKDFKTEFGRYYKFDFAIFNKEMEIIKLIELDGQQHFRSIEYWGGNEALELVKKRDKEKNEYCQKNDIPLLRIKYDVFAKIEEILKNELL